MGSGNPGILVANAHPGRRVPAGPVLRAAAGLLAAEGVPRRQAVNVIFLDDGAIRRLNRRFRRKDRPTDVLTFPFHDPDFLGEVYVSLDRARCQAREYGKTFSQELWLLVSHGLLHLCGYDDDAPAERRRMRAREARYRPLFLPHP